MTENKNIGKIELKISEKYPLEVDYPLGKELTVLLRGQISERKVKDNMDGSVDLILTLWSEDYEIVDEVLTKPPATAEKL